MAPAAFPIPSTEIAIRDDKGGDLPIGEAGELCVRGPQVMKGYWNKPEETAEIMTPDGFLRTGDIATIDVNGFVRIVDRKKDMINVSGLKVYPNEVEEVASMHPGVLEAGAVGVPNAFSGEAVKVVVVKRDPTLTRTDLKAHCRKYLTAYEIAGFVSSSFGRDCRRPLWAKFCVAGYATRCPPSRAVSMMRRGARWRSNERSRRLILWTVTKNSRRLNPHTAVCKIKYGRRACSGNSRADRYRRTCCRGTWRLLRGAISGVDERRG